MLSNGKVGIFLIKFGKEAILILVYFGLEFSLNLHININITGLRALNIAELSWSGCDGSYLRNMGLLVSNRECN